MKLSEILMNIELLEVHADLDTEIYGISYDSRNTKDGDLFVAIVGFESDGHKYIPMAKEKGAGVVVCERSPECDVPYIVVKNSRAALALASCEFFGNPSREMCVIGITGTNGKTTATYLLKHMLEDKLNAKVGLIGTNGNMIGDKFMPSERTTPESYELQRLFREMAESGCTHVVMEVSSHSLYLNRVAGIEFDVGVFSNLTQDHLDFHHTMEEYAEAKAMLFNMCKTGCFNLDDKWVSTMTKNASCRIMTFSTENSDADIAARDICLSVSGVSFTAAGNDEIKAVKLASPGRFSVYNALAVMCVGLAIGMSLDDCAEAMTNAKGVKGRMEVVPTKGDYTILIDYAHTPDALENALKTLKSISKGRLVVLFGCGGDRDRTKRPIMGGIAADNADFVIVTSDNPRSEEPQSIIDQICEGLENKNTPYKVICDRVEAIHWAIDKHMPNDVILLAGKGHEDYQIFGKEKLHLDEREVISEYINR